MHPKSTCDSPALVGRVASEASGVGVEVWRRESAISQLPPPRLPALRLASDPPHKGRGIACGFRVHVASACNVDFERDSRIHELLDILVIALAASSCAERNAQPTWSCSVTQRKSCCCNSCGSSTAFPATIRSAACSALWTRKRSSEPSGNSWRRSPRPMGSSSPAWWRSTAKPCVAPTSAARAAPAANGQCFCHGSADGARLAQGAQSQRGAGSLGNTADVVARRLHCYTDALHCSRPFATMVLERGAHYVLALKQNQSKLFNAVERRFARAGKRSVANSIEPSTHDRQEARRATVIRDTRVAAANRFPAWSRWVASHRADVSAESPPTNRSRVLPAVQVHARQTAAPDCAGSLGCRKSPALGARRRAQRGSRPSQKRQCAREPRCSATARRQHHSCSPRTHLNATKSKRAGLGRRLPSRPPQPHAIALPTRGRVKARPANLGLTAAMR